MTSNVFLTILTVLQTVLMALDKFKSLKKEERDAEQRKNLFVQLDMYFADLRYVKNIHATFHGMHDSLVKLKKYIAVNKITKEIRKDAWDSVDNSYNQINVEILKLLEMKMNSYTKVSEDEFNEIVDRVFPKTVGITTIKDLIIKLSANQMETLQKIDTFKNYYEIVTTGDDYKSLNFDISKLFFDTNLIVSNADSLIRFHLDMIQTIFQFLRLEL